MKLTNNINPGTYSILFEIFGYNGTNIVTDGDSDRLLFFNIEGDPIISDSVMIGFQIMLKRI